MVSKMLFFFFPLEGIAVPPVSWERLEFGLQTYGARVCVPAHALKDEARCCYCGTLLGIH